MNIPAGGQKRIVIVGATGMVGGHAFRYALENPAVQSVTSIGRRKLGMSHSKLKEVFHPEFADCTALAKALSGRDAAVFCLGAYTGTVSDAELRLVTVDYTIEFARVLRSSTDAAFSFLSGAGADSTGRSRMPLPANWEANCSIATGNPHWASQLPVFHGVLMVTAHSSVLCRKPTESV